MSEEGSEFAEIPNQEPPEPRRDVVPDLTKGDIEGRSFLAEKLGQVAPGLAKSDVEEIARTMYGAFYIPPTAEDTTQSSSEGSFDPKHPYGVAAATGALPRVNIRPGEITNLRNVEDPQAADLASFATARDFVDRLLEENGESERELFDAEVVRDILATIGNLVPDTIGVTTRVKEKLRRMVRARVKYHNANIKAVIGLSEFAGDFTSIREDEHKEIFETKGVQTALAELFQNNGAYFRIQNVPGLLPAAQPAVIAKNNIVAYLQTPAGGSLSGLEAERAFKLAERMSNIFGDSAYYDGVVDNAGNFKEFTNAGVPPGVYDVDYEAAAYFFEDNWNQIDINNSLKGQGTLGIKRLFYFPVQLQKEADLRMPRGKVDVLYRHLYMRVTSAARTNGKENVLDFMNNYKDLTNWALSLSAANKNRGVFYEKDEASVLNRPLLDPNTARRENEMEKAVATALDNWKKNTDEGFGYLGYEQKKLAKLHLLKGILRYVNSQDARNRFTYLGWNQNIRLEAIEWAVRDGDITREQAMELSREIGLSGLGIGWDASKGEIGNTLRSVLGGILKGLTRK